MRIAVTGASGFVGRHVVPALASAGHDVVAVLRPGREVPPWVAGAVRIVRADINGPGATDAAEVFAAMGAPAAVIHLAWGGLPNYKSLHHFERELPAQYAFLAGLVRAGLKHLTVTGTCFEYGMVSGALSEDMPTVPANPYGYAKDALRRQLQFLQADVPFSLAWARLFYMYGEGQAANSLIPQLDRALAAGDASFSMSGGEQLRDFLPVEDIARALVALTARGGNPGVVNVCSGKPISVRALVEHRIAKTGARITLNLGHYPYPDYEPMAFWGHAGKLTRLIGGMS